MTRVAVREKSLSLAVVLVKFRDTLLLIAVTRCALFILATSLAVVLSFTAEALVGVEVIDTLVLVAISRLAHAILLAVLALV